MSDYFSFNKVVLVGRITQDIHTREIRDGASKIVWFQLATNEIFKQKKSAHYHRIVCFGVLGEIVMKYGYKGRQVLIEGKLHSRSYEQDGVKKTMIEVLAEQLIFLEKKDTDQAPNIITTQQGESYKRPSYETESPEEQGGDSPEEEDVPF